MSEPRTEAGKRIEGLHALLDNRQMPDDAMSLGELRALRLAIEVEAATATDALNALAATATDALNALAAALSQHKEPNRG